MSGHRLEGDDRLQCRSPVVGVALFLCSLLLFTLETAATRHVGRAVPPEQLGLLRSLGGLVLVMVLAKGERTSIISTKLPWLQMLRGVISVLGLWTYYYAFSRLPLAEATIISYTKSLWLGLLAATVLGERVSPLRWGAIIIAAIGAAVVVNPGQISSDVACLVALGSAALSAIIITLTKVLERRDRPITVMFYVNVISFAVFAVPGTCHWTMSGDAIWWLLAIAFLGPLGQYVGLLAVRSTDTSLLAPFDYLRIVFAAILAYILLDETPGSSNVIGAMIIALGCCIAVVSAKVSAARPVAFPKRASAAGV